MVPSPEVAGKVEEAPGVGDNEEGANGSVDEVIGVAPVQFGLTMGMEVWAMRCMREIDRTRPRRTGGTIQASASTSKNGKTSG